MADFTVTEQWCPSIDPSSLWHCVSASFINATAIWHPSYSAHRPDKERGHKARIHSNRPLNKPSYFISWWLPVLTARVLRVSADACCSPAGSVFCAFCDFGGPLAASVRRILRATGGRPACDPCRLFLKPPCMSLWGRRGLIRPLQVHPLHKLRVRSTNTPRSPYACYSVYP